MRLKDVLDLEYDYTENEMDTINEINELIEEIKSNPELAVLHLELERDRFADIDGLCPKCGAELELIELHKEYRGEYQRTPSYETVGNYGCKECGYIQD